MSAGGTFDVDAPGLRTCPAPGEGVHTRFLHAVSICAKAGMTPEQAAVFIRARMTQPPRHREIDDAFEKAHREANTVIQVWRPGGHRAPGVAFDHPSVTASPARSITSPKRCRAFTDVPIRTFPSTSTHPSV